jgi:post-segregation antitoxin (ccd killing protein)
MRRTQIYLSDEQGRLLAQRSKATGVTVSQLIREAISKTYEGSSARRLEDRLAVARRAAGAWVDFPESGAEYVRRTRSGRRLAGAVRRI